MFLIVNQYVKSITCLSTNQLHFLINLFKQYLCPSERNPQQFRDGQFGATIWRQLLALVREVYLGTFNGLELELPYLLMYSLVFPVSVTQVHAVRAHYLPHEQLSVVYSWACAHPF